MRGSIFKAILIAGLLVGTADILLACLSAYIQNGVTPDRLLKYISSGLLGRSAMSGGTGMVLLGLLLHYFIAFCFTIACFLIFPRLKLNLLHPILVGIFYGLITWSVMALLVLPLAKTPPHPFRIEKALIAMLILIVAIGIPLAYMAKAYYKKTFHSNHKYQYNEMA